MKAQLKQKLFDYIVDHNPELVLKLQEDFKVGAYVEDKATAVMGKVKQWLSDGVQTLEVEEMALSEMAAELRPSRYLYLKNVLEEEFEREAEAFAEAGVLTYELVNLIEHCKETFNTFQFSEENQDNRKLRYLIIADIADYLN